MWKIFNMYRQYTKKKLSHNSIKKPRCQDLGEKTRSGHTDIDIHILLNISIINLNNFICIFNSGIPITQYVKSYISKWYYIWQQPISIVERLPLTKCTSLFVRIRCMRCIHITTSSFVCSVHTSHCTLPPHSIKYRLKDLQWSPQWSYR